MIEQITFERSVHLGDGEFGYRMLFSASVGTYQPVVVATSQVIQGGLVTLNRLSRAAMFSTEVVTTIQRNRANANALSVYPQTQTFDLEVLSPSTIATASDSIRFTSATRCTVIAGTTFDRMAFNIANNSEVADWTVDGDSVSIVPRTLTLNCTSAVITELDLSGVEVTAGTYTIAELIEAGAVAAFASFRDIEILPTLI